MKNTISIFKLFSDRNRVRLILILEHKELCVCELMGILGLTQPLISKNLALLDREGFLSSRKDGKLSFYKVKSDLTGIRKSLIEILTQNLKDDPEIVFDRKVAKLCSDFQSKGASCDMESLKAFQVERESLLEKEEN